jgi:uncharacterized protein YukE
VSGPGNGFTVDPEGLSANATRYGAHADDVAAIHLKLAEALDAAGDCWGNDPAGQAFAAKYVPAALSALRMMISTQRGLQSMVGGVYQWSASYVDSDKAVQEDLLKSFGSE